MSATRRLLRATVLIGLAVLVFVLFDHVDQRREARQWRVDARPPVANPPVEPDRPDLFEEPRVPEQPDYQ
ncbi:MAG: hypothetical protein R3192_16240 [Woeseiaceae bacterium]|nr:hypothetical protein [Woeseiaceae bacterium]